LRRPVEERIAWTRTYWLNEVEAALGEASIHWFRGTLASRRGRRAKRWLSESERELVRRLIDVAVHPVRRRFDRAAALQTAIDETQSTVERLRAHVEREFAKATGLGRKLQDRDVQEFWRMARDLAGAILLKGR
jgi:hypothetical protein